MSMSVVDLGTKFGTSIATFLRKSATFFPDQIQSGTLQTTPAFECIGVDIDETYRGDVEGRGHQFMCGDVLDRSFWASLPEADFYLVCNLLHHLGDVLKQLDILCYTLEKARRGVWFRVKSFEKDEKNGEGILISKGFQFCWSRSYSSYTISELLFFINRRLPGGAIVRIEPGKRIRHTKDKRVIPLLVENDSDAYYYERAMGAKEYMELPTPVVCEWDIFVEIVKNEVNTDQT